MNTNRFKQKRVTGNCRHRRKSSLPRGNAHLVELMQAINFGRITFHVRGGQFDLGRPYRSVQTLKLDGGEHGPRPEAAKADFELRKEHIALLARLEHLPDGTCVTVKVAHGLPNTSVDIEEEHRICAGA